MSNVNTRHPGLFNPLLVFVTLRYNRHYSHYARKTYLWQGLAPPHLDRGHSPAAPSGLGGHNFVKLATLIKPFLSIHIYILVVTLFCCGGELNSDKWFDGARVPWARTDVQCPAVASGCLLSPALTCRVQHQGNSERLFCNIYQTESYLNVIWTLDT